MKRSCIKLCFIIGSILWSVALSAAQSSIQLGYAAFEKKQWRDAYEYWVPEADKGDARAQYYLSILFSKGLGVEQSEETALTFLTLAAEGGFATAQYQLGNNYQHGELIEQDSDSALYWWKKAAEQQHTHAQLKMGALYYLGRGVDKDLDKAAEWYRLAAKSGSPQAIETLNRLGINTIEEPLADVLSFSNASELVQTAVSPNALITTIPDDLNSYGVVSEDGRKGAVTNISYRLQAKEINETDKAVKGGSVEQVTKPATGLNQQKKPGLNDLNDMAWIERQPGDFFTLQIFSSDKQESAERVALGLKSDWRVTLFPFGRYGYRWYGVLAGSFETMEQAIQAKKVILENNKLETPWIRRFRSIRKRDDESQ
ncbi:MAG: hypothetical protein OQL27_00820 [Sedimenticola sp.]|nr:hypothetical protein [Sedimenticola sp.]